MEQHTDALVFVVVATLGLLLLTTFCLWFLFAYQKKQFKHQQEMGRLKEVYDQEILKTELEIKEQTLRTISAEIHDNVGQVLSLAKLMLSSLDMDAVSADAEKVKQVIGLISRGMTDLRDLSKTLNANTLTSQGLAQALRYEAELLRKTNHYRVDFQLSGVEHRLDPSVELIVYRIAQEVLNNIIRHADATGIGLQVAFTPGQVCLTIHDNGTGFNPDTIRNNSNQLGAGLRNMQNRALLIGADLLIESRAQQGTWVRLTVPQTTPLPNITDEPTTNHHYRLS